MQKCGFLSFLFQFDILVQYQFSFTLFVLLLLGTTHWDFSTYRIPSLCSWTDAK